MNDDRIDALIRQLDVPSDASVAFAERTLENLLPRVHRARSADARWFSGFTRALRASFGASAVAMPARIRPLILLTLLALVLLCAILAVVLIGSRHVPSTLGNGPLIVATPEGLRRIVAGAGGATAVVVDEPTKGASRSPDGSLISFWTTSSSGDRLEVVGVDGTGRPTLTSGVRLAWNGCIDTSALDSHAVAAEVLVDGVARILVADTPGGRRPLAPSRTSGRHDRCGPGIGCPHRRGKRQARDDA
jgi:hypothetical protein